MLDAILIIAMEILPTAINEAVKEPVKQEIIIANSNSNEFMEEDLKTMEKEVNKLKEGKPKPAPTDKEVEQFLKMGIKT